MFLTKRGVKERMMMNKRLIDFVPESRKYIAGNVALQWVSLLANIGMMTAITQLLAALFGGTADGAQLAGTAILAALAVAVRFACHHRGVTDGLFVLAHGQKSPA